jgi:hypothetical protein
MSHDFADARPSHTDPHRPAPFDWRGGVRWFAAEFLVVVTGILVALALQAWYEGRREADRERSYLAQLDADLLGTERLLAEVDSLNRPSDLAGSQMMRAFYAATPPPRDSILDWFVRSNQYELARPVTATAEALVTTGDLNLIRSDSVRAAVATYLEASQRLVASQATYETEFLRASDDMDRKIDFVESIPASVPQAVLDSVARANPMFPLPPGPRRHPFPVDTDELLRDRDAHFAIGQMISAKRNMASIRREMRESAQRLRALVTAERARRANGRSSAAASPERTRGDSIGR